MEIQDKEIKLVRDQVTKSKSISPRRPNFPKGMKESVVMLLQSGIAAVDLAQRSCANSGWSIFVWSPTRSKLFADERFDTG